MMESSEKHDLLVEELLEVFQLEGFRILAASGVKGYAHPHPLPNDGYGDQEPKAPDVYAFDDKRKQHVIGIVKEEESEFESEHSLTQYNVFLDQFDRSTGIQARLFVMVPSSKIAQFNTLITHYIHRDYWPNIVVVSSKAMEE